MNNRYHIEEAIARIDQVLGDFVDLDFNEPISEQKNFNQWLCIENLTETLKILKEAEVKIYRFECLVNKKLDIILDKLPHQQN